MPVVLDNDVGHRVLLYGADGATLLKVAVDSSGRLRISEPRAKATAVVNAQYNVGGVAPHGTTTRWTYTVPASTITIVDLLRAQIMRDGAAAPAAAAAARINLTPNGGAAALVLVALEIQAALGTPVIQSVAGALWLHVGDVLVGQTFDFSTGGTYDYGVSFHGIEFAA